MQLKVKNSCELKKYVSRNISSSSWNSTVNKVGVLAKFVFIQALLKLFNWWIAICSPLIPKRFIDDGSKNWKWFDKFAKRLCMNQLSLILNSIWNSLFHSLHRSRTLNLTEDRFQTITFSYTTQYARKKKTKRKNKVGALTTIFAVG